VPFDFLKRKPAEPAADAAATASSAATADAGRGTVFDGYTEEWRLVGRMEVDTRLSDALNKRDPITISDVRWAPIDGSSPLADAPGLQSIDPYDLIIVIAGTDSLPPMTDEERNAHRIHKVHYELMLEAPPFKVFGTVALYPGADPSRLLDRSSEMFVPVTGARATLGDLPVEIGDVQDILVNRFYLRGIEQVDIRTGEKAEPIPGLTPGSGGRPIGDDPRPGEED
jgi:hypothetical protein